MYSRKINIKKECIGFLYQDLNKTQSCPTVETRGGLWALCEGLGMCGKKRMCVILCQILIKPIKTTMTTTTSKPP